MFKQIYKTYKEYWGYYWRVTSRHAIPGIFEWDKRLVDFIEHACGLKSGMNVLDLGCGGGDQLKVFAEKGYGVTGIDMVPSLIEFAENQFKNAGLRGEFICGDMRDCAYSERFDAVTLLSGTFGFFEELENLELLKVINRSLKPGGKVFIDYLTPERFMHPKERSWGEIEGGYSLREEWFDAERFAYRSRTMHVFSDGTVFLPAREDGYCADEVIRCYPAPELEGLMRQAGFENICFYNRKAMDDWGYKPAGGEDFGMAAGVKK